MLGLQLSRSDRDLDLARLLGGAVATTPVVGVEHEYSVVRRHDSARLDFAQLVHALRLGRPHLDPDDPNAYRLASGAVVTADKEEAELALAPAPVAPGFARRVADAAAAERAALARRLPGVDLDGYSTHISVEVPEGLEVPVGRLYVNRFGPAMLLAMDGADAPGVRIRPRSRRLELCGDFVDGDRLAAALKLAAGSVLACVAALTRPQASQVQLPPAVRTRWLPAIERRGWFVDRSLVGLTGPGGDAGSMELVDGDRMDAAVQVAVARAAAARALDARLASSSPSRATPADRSFGAVLAARRRRNVALAPVMVTWPVTVLIAADVRSLRRGFVVVPRDWLGRFVAKLDRGDLDDALGRFIGSRLARTASDWRDARQPGLFRDIAPRLALLPPEPI